MPASTRFELRPVPPSHVARTFAEDVADGLGAPRKRLSPKYFYDALGSALFEAICELAEYDLTRNEVAILERHADEMVAAVGPPIDLIELGSGSARKGRLVISAALARQETLVYQPIDVSIAALQSASADVLGDFPALRVIAHAADYRDLLGGDALARQHRALVLFLGSNVGNYEPDAARALLEALRLALRSGDALLLGTDLKKDPRELEAAYDDPTGVTAAFDRNVLGRINRELGGTFDLRAFRFVAHYDAERGAVDSFLESTCAQRAFVAALGREFSFAAGERIHTESSYKFSPADIEALAADTGWTRERMWNDARERFAVTLLRVP